MGVFGAENRKKGEKTGRQRENNGGAGDFFAPRGWEKIEKCQQELYTGPVELFTTFFVE